MRLSRIALLAGLTLAVVSAALPAVAGGKSSKRHFALRWLATDSATEEPIDLTGLGSVRLQVLPLTDARLVVTQIGENREKEDKGPLPVTTDTNVADFVTQALRDGLRRSGLPVHDDGATHVLSGSIQELTVVLDGTYKSSTRVRLTLKDAAGTEQWTGLVVGTTTRFSMLEGPENYLKSLCDSILEAFDGFVGSEALLTALRN